MIFDCVFLHRNVLEAVTSPGSPRRLPTRSSRGAGAGLGSHCSSCCSSRCSSRCPLQRGPCGAGTAAGGTSVAQVAGAGHGDVPWPGWGWRWHGRSSSRTRRVHKDWETGVLVLFIPCTFHRHEIEKGEIYEENLISHSCWMDLVWYWPDFTMCLLKALEYILYVKDCNNFKKK